MQYFGGKQRIAKHLSVVINPIVHQRGCYVEPFVGGAAVMTTISASKRIGSDSNSALIQMWRSLSNGWQPPVLVSESEYARVKNIHDPFDPNTAFIGFGCSFAGKWFGGYARNASKRNYAASAVLSLRKKMQYLVDVQWENEDYRDLSYPADSVIYCDPPYTGTTQYGAVGAFNSVEFWDWCLKKHDQGYAIFVSEYTAPDTFEAILTIPTRTNIRTKANGREARLEKLFVPKGSKYK